MRPERSQSSSDLVPPLADRLPIRPLAGRAKPRLGGISPVAPLARRSAQSRRELAGSEPAAGAPAPTAATAAAEPAAPA